MEERGKDTGLSGGGGACPILKHNKILDEWNYEETYHRDTMPYSFRSVAQDLSAEHTKAFDYPVMDHWGKVKVLWHEADSNRRPVGPQSTTLTTRPRWLPEDQIHPGSSTGGDLLPTVGGGGRLRYRQ